MSNLNIVGIEVPDGLHSRGTKVKLSNGSYLTGIRSIKFETSVDQPIWNVSLEVMPDFSNQETIQALLKDLKVVDCEVAKTTNEATDNHTEEAKA